MLTRIDWLNNGIEQMLAGKSPLTPEQWGMRGTIVRRDVDLLRQAAELNSLRSEAAEPDEAFIERLRNRVIAAAASTELE